MSPFVNIHTHHYIDNKDLIQIVNIDIDNLNVDVSYFHSVGIHPWESLRSTDYSLQTLSTLSHILSFSNSQFLKAIGECGIDRACDIDIEIQKDRFSFRLLPPCSDERKEKARACAEVLNHSRKEL